jgi:D-3-phosphoglycerate dehydrogenase
MPNVLCTPHLGASTKEAQSQVAVEAAQLLIDFFRTGAINHAVNMPPLDPKTVAGLRGYLNVAYRLGLLLAQVHHFPPTTCKLYYQGEVARKNTQLLSAAFVAGLLENALDLPVNLVNAEVILSERGIQLLEERSLDIGNFHSLLTAQVISESKTSSAAGTLFGDNTPRLVRKDNFWLESRLEGFLFLTVHRDVPGVVGKLGEVFGRHQINIAYLSVGRGENEPGSEAIGVLSLDSLPPNEAVTEILALEPILQAGIVRLPPPNKLPPWMGG